ncbi:MAG: hypothetical protein LJE65_00035 [Desulfobacteraceae bacterium]|nr:hypothetical protein [Desulfobacteraceae bacterium]
MFKILDEPDNTKTLAPDRCRRRKRKYLINKLNYLHFTDGSVLIRLRHSGGDFDITLCAKPAPCFDETLDCVLSENDEAARRLHPHAMPYLLVPMDSRLLVVRVDDIQIEDGHIRIRLPETCYEVNVRKAVRYPCRGVSVQLDQNAIRFQGRLLDFSAVSLRVEIEAGADQSLKWLVDDAPVHLTLTREDTILFSGDCRLKKRFGDAHKANLILSPLNEQLKRFRSKHFRSTRQRLTPSPDAIFRHPLSLKVLHRKVYDISGGGFSVEEDSDTSVLLPGLLIPGFELDFGGGFSVSCTVQIVYRIPLSDVEDSGRCRCGLVFLDLPPSDHQRMVSFIHRAADERAFVSDRMDMDELWCFLFDSGFIYPKKYGFLHANRDEIKSTYEKFYRAPSHLAQHFVHRCAGRITGHIAMLRFYDQSWMIHHHAAHTEESVKSGLLTLSCLSRFINESEGIGSIGLQYLFCYFRPQNRFPNRIFGGAASRIDNPQFCSVDPFAFFHFQRTEADTAKMPRGWRLTDLNSLDHTVFQHHYMESSGGLLLDAFDLRPDSPSIDALAVEYGKAGLKREKHLLALKKNDQLKAVLLVNQTDVGLNLSELTNSLHFIVTDPTDFPETALLAALYEICRRCDRPTISCLVHPMEFGRDRVGCHERQYNLWILDMQCSDEYFRYLSQLLSPKLCK